MIKIKTVNILGQPKDILDLKIEYDKTPKNIPTVSEDCLEVHENCAYHLSNNLRLNEISMLIIFQFYCKISKKNNQEQLQKQLMAYTLINALKH